MKRYKPLFESEDQTQTPEFKKWFGKSKVVDHSGKPLVLYHGSLSDFTNFAPKRMGHGELAPNSSFYFTTEKENAKGYANVNNMSGKIFEVFLSIQKPKIVTSIEEMREAEKTAKRRGYDGIIAKGVKDGRIVSDIYIAFYPNQIKSATNNNGEFDPHSDNINESTKRYRPLFEWEANPDRDLLLYHGSPKPLTSFKSGILFLTPSDEDAVKFGLGGHRFGKEITSGFLYTVAGKRGKIYDGDEVVSAFIMEEEHPDIPEEEYTESKGDLDIWIKDFYSNVLRKKGYHYLQFSHPAFSDNEIDVYVSLYPDKDLKIIDEDKI